MPGTTGAMVHLQTLPYAALVESSISSHCAAELCLVVVLNTTFSYLLLSPALVVDEGSRVFS